MFKVDNLTLYYFNNKKKTYLLKNISFSLNKGDSLGIIGKSGQGKSTLAKALLKIYDNNVLEENGKIYLNDTLFNSSFRGRKISILFQNPNSYLNPLMKVGKQISEMLTTHLKLSYKEAKSRALEFMKEVGLVNVDKLYNYYPSEISGGMQQKICLCIALICNPDVLVLDECTSYLDSTSKKEILSLIRNMQKEKNFTIIMISHDLSEIYSMCNKIAIMQNCQIVEFGKTDEIITNPLHPYTIEILNDFLRFHENIEPYTCPIHDMSVEEFLKVKIINDTHYIQNFNSNGDSILPKNLDEIKEKLYEYLNHK